jgi:hypothetical protein
MSPKKTQDSSNAFKQNNKGNNSIIKKLPLFLILVIVIVAFVLVPLISGFTPQTGGKLVFGTYGSEKIEYVSGSYFYNQVNMLNNMYRDQISESQELFDFYRYYIWSSAYQQAVQFAVKKYDLEQSGFRFSDRGISRLIVESGYYDNDQGVFDEALYASVTPAQRDEIKVSVMESAYLDQYNTDRLGGMFKSQQEIDFIIEASPVEKQFRYVSFSSSQYPENEVLAYGKSHSNLFTSYPLARITTATRKEAEDIIKELTSGDKTFSEAAISYSSDMYSTSGGVIGDVARYSLIDELGEEKSNAVFNLGEGNFSSEPIETDYGWYIYQVNGPAQEPDFTDANMISSIRNWMAWNEAATIDSWVMDSADSFIASLDKNVTNSFTLEAVSQGLEVKSTEFFPLNWGSSPLIGTGLNSANDSIIQGASQSDDFFKQAFSLNNAGDISQPVILDNAVIVLELMGTRDSESKPNEYTCYSQLQQVHEGLYSSMVTDSDLYEDNFMETYYQVFPPESTEES